MAVPPGRSCRLPWQRGLFQGLLLPVAPPGCPKLSPMLLSAVSPMIPTAMSKGLPFVRAWQCRAFLQQPGRHPCALWLRQKLLKWLHFCLKYGPCKWLRAFTTVLSSAASHHFSHTAHRRCGRIGLMAAVLPCLRLLLLAWS